MTLIQRWRQQLTPLAQHALALPPPPGGLRLWITLLSFGFVLAALVSHGGQVLQLRLDLQGWLWLLLGVGLSLVSLVVNGFGLGVVLRWLGLRPRWQALVLAHLDTNLRKYLPGGIWHLTSRVQLLRGGEAPLSQPASTSQALLAVLLDPLVAAVAALTLVSLGGWQAGLALVALVPLVLLWPHWLQPLLLRLERRQAARLGLEPAAATAPLIPGYPWPPLLAQLVFVLLRFSGFACCVLAFELQGSLEWSGWLAGFALAWTAGLVVPGAPGGLGVFEAVLLLRLGMAVPEAQLLAVVISYRAVVTFADLLAEAVARLDRRWQV
jgi:uncharacterized membrane protein YbhN (UPF0104 family)